MPATDTKKRYFAGATEKPEELVAQVAARVQECAKDFNYSDAAIAHEHLYGDSLRFGSQSQVLRGGDEGELVKLRANKAKALLKSWVGLMLGAPMTPRPKARNDNIEARSAVKSTTDLLEHFARERGLNTFIGEVGEAGGAFREAYALVGWDETKGEEVGFDFDSAATVWSGGLWVRLAQKWDVFFDKQYRSWQDVPWVCVRTYESRHAIAALESDERRKESILSASDAWFQQGLSGMVDRKPHSSDVVAVFNFFHRPDPACPDGLALRFLSSDLQLGASKPCKQLPVVRFTPAVKLDSAEGDSQWQGVLGLQEMRDSVNSAVATNLDAFGTQAVEMPAEFGISVDRLNNVKVFERPIGLPPGQVVPVQLVRQPEGVDKILDMWASDMLDIVGLNDVSQGQPDSAQMNAAAFAILKSAATERNSQPQRRLLDFYGELCGLVLGVLSENMSEEDFITIVGRGARSRYPSQKVGRSKLGLVESVYIEVGNALEQTVAGRVQVALMLLETGALKDPRDLLTVLETGRMPESMDRAVDEQNHVEWENEEILAGRVPTIFFTHDALTHCPGHACVALNPAALQSRPVLMALKAHLDAHYDLFWPHDAMWPVGAPPDVDPRYPDRMRVILGQQAPGQLGPPPGPPGGAPENPGQQPPVAPSDVPPVLAPPGVDPNSAPSPEMPPPMPGGAA